MAKFNAELKLWESAKLPYPYPLDTFMGEEILKKLKETPYRVVQINQDNGHEIRCEELRVSSVRIAQNLIKSGIKADDVIGVICKNSNEVTFLLNACVLIGAPINPLDLSITKDDIKHLFGQTLPKLVICDLEVFYKVQQALTELKLDAKIHVTSKNLIDGALSFFDLLTPTGNEDEFISPKFDQTAEEKLLAILCSSGTTGLPKGVKITHATVLIWTALFFNSAPPTRSLNFSPIYWGTGFYPHILRAFNANDSQVLTNQAFSVETLLEMVEQHQLTHLTLPPMHMIAILNSDFSKSCKHEYLKNITCVGSIVSESLRQKFSEVFPNKMLTITYGLTEIMISTTRPGEFKENLSVGSIFLPNIEMKILDDDEQRLGVNEVGELCAKPAYEFQVSFELKQT
jgi:4-coumarate--CoA ligase